MLSYNQARRYHNCSFMKNVKIGIVQTACTANKAENLAKAVEKIKEVAQKGAQIVCLQELFTSLYFCDIEDYTRFDLAEPIPGPSTEILAKTAQECGVAIVASLFENRADAVYHNTAAVIDADGTYLGKYRKMHIPDDPGYHEKFYFTPGDLGYKVFETKFAKIGVLICWDQWYPEPARLTALLGAEILFYPTAIGWPTDQAADYNEVEYSAWQTMMRSHAIANGLHVVAVNRVGKEANNRFWGGSFVSNPFGKILYQAPHEQELTHVQEIDLADNKWYRQRWPFLRDRRIDSYAPLTKRLIDE